MEGFNRFLERLGRLLEQPLPGVQAHELLMPEERKALLRKPFDLSNARRAGVLVLLYPENEETRIVFIKRSEYEGVHSGQIAFPGGQYEKYDDNLQKTALRETEEEIGVNQDSINILGSLSEIYIPPSNYLVLPVIGWVNYIPEFNPDPSEVERVLTFSFDDFMKSSAFKTETIRTSEYLIRDIPCFKVDGHIIWGATSMIMSELVQVARYK